MTAKQFIESKGAVSDPDVWFVNAGNTVVIPLAELLEEYAKLSTTSQAASAAMPILSKSKKKKA